MMTGDNAVRIYEMLWSILAISGGLFLVFCSQWFIEKNATAFEKLHQRFGLEAFKVQAWEMRKPYMNLLVPLLGLVFLIVGALVLLGKISI